MQRPPLYFHLSWRRRLQRPGRREGIERDHLGDMKPSARAGAEATVLSPPIAAAKSSNAGQEGGD